MWIENPAPSHRYPKLWDLPEFKRLVNRHARRLAMVQYDACAWGAGPKDGQPTEFHKKPTQVIMTNVLAIAKVLHRRCPGLSVTHQHVHPVLQVVHRWAVKAAQGSIEQQAVRAVVGFFVQHVLLLLRPRCLCSPPCCVYLVCL